MDNTYILDHIILYIGKASYAAGNYNTMYIEARRGDDEPWVICKSAPAITSVDTSNNKATIRCDKWAIAGQLRMSMGNLAKVALYLYEVEVYGYRA